MLYKLDKSKLRQIIKEEIWLDTDLHWDGKIVIKGIKINDFDELEIDYDLIDKNRKLKEFN